MISNLSMMPSCRIANWEIINKGRSIFCQDLNYSPVGQLPTVKMMARPTKLVAPGVGRCYLSSPEVIN